MWMVLNAEEEEPEVPMDVEETGAGCAKKKETLKFPCSSRTTILEKFSKETNHTNRSNYSSSISSNNIFGNHDPCRLKKWKAKAYPVFLLTLMIIPLCVKVIHYLKLLGAM